MLKSRVLVVDDEEGMLEVCSDILHKMPDTEVITENTSERAVERVVSENFQLMVADIRMPGVNGLELLRIARQHDPTLPVLMLTAFPTVETAVESMKLGAVDYITKPFLPDDLLATVRRLLEEKELREENRVLRRMVERPYCFDEIVGKSTAMQNVFETIKKIADTDVDVFIMGETGTGKELVAGSIHKRSRRKNGRFVPVDCGAIPGDLLESEFFGHERGAFTGAHTRRMGRLEFANQGTFFLDEIGDLPLMLQAKLLRVLQERKIRRVGAQEEIDVDLRVIAATARDLTLEMRERRFRDDLFYRINVARIELPPLRDRLEDIPLLIEHFTNRYAQELGLKKVEIDPKAMEFLLHYSWPGNVRELQNVLRRTLAMVRCETLSIDDLPDEILIQAAQTNSFAKDRNGFFRIRAQRMDAFEKEYLADLLSACHGDIVRAVQEAQIPRATLYRLLKKHNFNPEHFRSKSQSTP
ncbi:MAG TPA: sigma-54 dependent transcriptional regulator [Acidobacteriota bacterium]|nr:sigma-54 dependent transcriptional regulator [Acidobacteriota bacterium]